MRLTRSGPRSHTLLAVVLGGLLLAASPPGEARAAPAAAPSATSAPKISRVLAISLDGLNPQALRRLGRQGAPHLWRLLDQGASTLEARTDVDFTDTLPDHTSMVTGRPVHVSSGGHGVTWDVDRRRPRTVQEAAGAEIGSVFTRVHLEGGSTALFSTKEKLRLLSRSWPAGVDRTTVRAGRDAALTRAARSDLARRQRELTFVHLGGIDVAGHVHGFMSRGYLRAVRRVDALVGDLARTVRQRPSLRDTAIVLTADHGGRGAGHHDPSRAANYRVPFLVWGPGVDPAGLYSLNRAGGDYGYPGRRQIPYDARRQPVRNGLLANVSLDLLGLEPVSGSRFDPQQDLRVR